MNHFFSFIRTTMIEPTTTHSIEPSVLLVFPLVPQQKYLIVVNTALEKKLWADTSKIFTNLLKRGDL